jgi:hypothetical protein
MPMGFSVLTVTMCIDEDGAGGAGGGVTTRGGDLSYSILTGGVGSATGCCKIVGIIVGCGVGT